MKFVTDPLRALVQKKLWPVAVLLIAALVAVPYTLAKEPEAPPPAPANAAEKEAGMPATFVSAVDEAAGEEKRRRVLGVTKDPFEPAPLPKAKKAKKKDAEKPEEDKAESKPADKPSSGGGAPKADAPPPVPTVTFPANSIIVGFGVISDSAEPELQALDRMRALPSEESPLVVFTGLKKNGKVAEFMLTGIVTAEGDGKCLPRPEDCQTLRLRKGETQFLTITGTGEETDGQYQLDVHEIFAKKTEVPVTANVGGEGLRKKASRIFLDGGK